jgi:hypothetical protein
MKSAVCTLFEGHYHHGVAALCNSLHSQGYLGEVYVGYRGNLPIWSDKATHDPSSNWIGSKTLVVDSGLRLHFLPIDTSYFLANYKPDFMLRLWQELAIDAKALFYFDPDIIITTPWSVFEEWIEHGVALCEDVHSPKAMHHPVRAAWRQYFYERGINLSFKEAFYANSGFIGVKKNYSSFLKTWQLVQEAMAPAIGGLGTSFLTTVPGALPFAPFSLPDQDALNAAVEAWDGVISFVGKAGMGFTPSSSLMSHAIGSGKPWVRSPLAQIVSGNAPRRADKDYWNMARGPIMSQPAGLIRRRQLAIKIAALIGRFYSKN